LKSSANGFGGNKQMSDKLPTFSNLKRYHKELQQMSFSSNEAWEDIVQDLLVMLKSYRKAAKGWERDYDKLKAKYEPGVMDYD